jgi:hypothetical protein
MERNNADRWILEDPAKVRLFPEQRSAQFPLEGARSSFSIWNFGTGIGSFPDIQLPADPLMGVQIDGRPAGVENEEHMGVPFYLSGALSRQNKRWKWTFLKGGAMAMKAFTGAEETFNTSYSRVNVGTSLAVLFRSIGRSRFSAILSGHLDFRRSSFANVSTAHFIESPVSSFQIEVFSRTLKLAAEIGLGLQPRFGFSQDRLWGGRSLPSSRASLTTGELRGSWAINPETAFDLGVDLEKAQVRLNDAGDYQQFDLQTADTSYRRDYQLTTWVTKVGVSKLF